MALLTIFLGSLLVFVLLRMMPGDIISARANTEAVARGISFEDAWNLVVQMYNFDPNEPLISQITRYYSALFRGDLGYSMTDSGVRVSFIIRTFMPWTLFLVSQALILSYFLGIFLGSVMAWKRKSIFSVLIAGYGTMMQAIPFALVPTFIMALLVFPRWSPFPIAGSHSLAVTPGFNLPFIADIYLHAAMPILAFATTQVNMWIMQMKGSATMVMAEDYVTAGYARGLSHATIRRKYVKKNALIPLYVQLAISFGAMVGGAPLMEGPFVYPGIGGRFGAALGQRDFTTVQGIVLFMIAATVFSRLLVEFMLPKLDPRVKAGG